MFDLHSSHWSSKQVESLSLYFKTILPWRYHKNKMNKFKFKVVWWRGSKNFNQKCWIEKKKIWKHQLPARLKIMQITALKSWHEFTVCWLVFFSRILMSSPETKNQYFWMKQAMMRWRNMFGEFTVLFFYVAWKYKMMSCA